MYFSELSVAEITSTAKFILNVRLLMLKTASVVSKKAGKKYSDYPQLNSIP
jgi:hypothetical protein